MATTSKQPKDTVPVSIRFSRKAIKQIERVARLDGESTSSWIRRQALTALRQQAAA